MTRVFSIQVGEAAKEGQRFFSEGIPANLVIPSQAEKITKPWYRQASCSSYLVVKKPRFGVVKGA